MKTLSSLTALSLLGVSLLVGDSKQAAAPLPVTTGTSVFPYYPTPTIATDYVTAQNMMAKADSANWIHRGGYACIRNRMYFAFPQNTATRTAVAAASGVTPSVSSTDSFLTSFEISPEHFTARNLIILASQM